MPHICVSELRRHSAPSHYLNQWWVIVNWTFRNRLQWNFNQIQNFSFVKMHLEISSVKWWPFCPGWGWGSGVGVGWGRCWAKRISSSPVNDRSKHITYCVCIMLKFECGNIVHIADIHYTADSGFAPSQWETSLQSNAVSHRLGANLESALHYNLKR